MAASDRFDIQGHVNRGFEAVREAFAENFVRRGELGGACCAFHGGEKVVDLWGGIRNKLTGEPWEQDTMVIIYSATKGLAAMTLAIAHSRRWLDYEERVCAYWPEFAQNGKEDITVRNLLTHHSGLRGDLDLTQAWQGHDTAFSMAFAETPVIPPGSRFLYSDINFIVLGALIERVTGKRLGSFGRPGSFPGQFNQVHGIAVDSKGHVYLDENRGRRVHKFRAVTR